MPSLVPVCPPDHRRRRESSSPPSSEIFSSAVICASSSAARASGESDVSHQGRVGRVAAAPGADAGAVSKVSDATAAANRCAQVTSLHAGLILTRVVKTFVPVACAGAVYCWSGFAGPSTSGMRSEPRRLARSVSRSSTLGPWVLTRYASPAASVGGVRTAACPLPDSEKRVGVTNAQGR